MATPIACTPKSLPQDLFVHAANVATGINALNHPHLHELMTLMPGFKPTQESIAVVTKKFWHTNGVRLTVGFLDSPPADLRARILLHMNAWSRTANVSFVESMTDPRVRIARTEGAGYWSYLGTDILSIPADQPTMNLEGFTMDTPDSEFHRVVRHETGHTLGCPHEHLRQEMVNKIDPVKAIEFYQQTQGWSEQYIRAQVLTPIEEASLLGTSHDDPNSIMCYQIPSTITKDGQPILGGLDIDDQDFAFMATVYPRQTSDTQPTVTPTRTPQTANGGRSNGAGIASGAAESDLNRLQRELARALADRETLKKAIGIIAS